MRPDNDNGLFMHEGNPLGYLMHFPEHGTFDANLGLVDVTKDEANTHNNIMETMLVEGLDKCPVGSGGIFYHDMKNYRPVVQTFLGQTISDDASIKLTVIRFTRKGMVFQGTPQTDSNAFFAIRVK